jgi:hypothetical protein
MFVAATAPKTSQPQRGEILDRVPILGIAPPLGLTRMFERVVAINIGPLRGLAAGLQVFGSHAA